MKHDNLNYVYGQESMTWVYDVNCNDLTNYYLQKLNKLDFDP